MSHFVPILEGDKASRFLEEPFAHLARELKTWRLDSIHNRLWLAGLPAAARPLHRQRLLGRSIVITEDPNEHIVWLESQIFIKPLPEFLLEWEYWNNGICPNSDIHRAACGMLLSYAWLIRHKSDLKIAKEVGLLPGEIEWSCWVELMGHFLRNINCETLEDVSPRYRYGELRLSRLNTIYRLAPPAYSLRNLIKGYQSRSSWFKAFFERHFTWMLALFAILSVVLSAFQVGLASETLQHNQAFQSVSYGFTIVSLVALATCIALIFPVWLVLFCYHLLHAWRNDRVVERRRLLRASVPCP